jgi:hypothetical protein
VVRDGPLHNVHLRVLSHSGEVWLSLRRCAHAHGR